MKKVPQRSGRRQSDLSPGRASGKTRQPAVPVRLENLPPTIASLQRLVAKLTAKVIRQAEALRPPVLDDLGLIPAIHSLAKSVSKQAGIRVDLTVSAAVEKLDIAQRTILYRVVQESLSNVVRHAHASRVDVQIQKLARTVRLTIQDDGRTFDVERAWRAAGKKRLGLIAMRERIALLGGRLSIESIRGIGTTIRAVIPLTAGSQA